MICSKAGMMTTARPMLLVTLSRDIEYDLRNDYFAHLESLPRSFFHGRHTGDLMARATNDLQAVVSHNPEFREFLAELMEKGATPRERMGEKGSDDKETKE